MKESDHGQIVGEGSTFDERLSSLVNASLLLNSTLNLRDILHTLTLFATQHTGADRATLYLVADDGKSLVGEIVQGEELQEIRLDLGRGIAGQVATSKRPARVDDVQKVSTFDATVDVGSGYTTLNLLAVPILDRRGRALGVVQVLNKQDGRMFDEADQAYLIAIAAQAAVAIQNALVYEQLQRERSRLDQENRELQKQVSEPTHSGRNAKVPMGEDPVFVEVLELVKRVADSNATVLIRGESGSGKGVLAKYIHALSPRAKGPLVQINCSAIPDSLIESELFGVEAGVATGVTARRGRIEMAHGGTCFLDEIGDMSPAAQAKILKVIEDREVERVGGRRAIAIDVRIIAATHQNLETLVEEKEFRADLFHRLNVVSVELPALRERGNDVADLARAFLSRLAHASRRSGALDFSQECVEALLRYDWPGNVRELENVVERAVLLSDGDVIGVEALPPGLRGEGHAMVEGLASDGFGDSAPAPVAAADLRKALARYERALLQSAMRAANGVQQRAARSLGISESNLRYKLKKHELDTAGESA